MKTLGMNRILLVSTPTLNQWYNLEKQFPKCGLLTPGDPLRPIQESFEVITVFKIILRHFIFFTDICTYDPKATLNKTTAGNSILT